MAMVAACPFPARRGTPQRIRQMGDALHRAGYDVHVVTYHLGLDEETPGLSVHRTRRLVSYREFGPGPNYRKLLILDPLLVRRLAIVVRQHRIRWIHAHHFEGALCALLIRRLVGGIRILYDAHTTLRHEIYDYPFFRLPRFIKKVASDVLDGGIPRWVDHVVTVSDRLKDFIVQQGVPEERVTSIPMGINIGEFTQQSRESAKAELGLGDGPLIVYTGNLAAFQGVHHLVDALPRVRDAIPGVRLLLVGGHGTGDELDRRLAGLPPGLVTSVGDPAFGVVQKYLAAADVLALPRDECMGFPLKLLNYLAAGRAVVAFEGSGGEAIRDGHNGLLVPGSSSEAFGDALVRCLSDASLSARLGAEARNTAVRYGQIALDRRVAELYRRLIAADGGPPGADPQ